MNKLMKNKVMKNDKNYFSLSFFTKLSLIHKFNNPTQDKVEDHDCYDVAEEGLEVLWVCIQDPACL